MLADTSIGSRCTMNGFSSEPRIRSPHLAREGPVGVGQQHPELVAAQARHAVAVAERVAEARRELAHDQVAVVVAERIGDVLEAVERQDQQRQRPGGARRLDERAAQPVQQHHPVRQAGELVVEAEPPQRLLGHALLGDVEHEAAHEARLAARVRQHAPLVAPPHDAAVAVEDAVLAAKRPPVAHASRNCRSTRSRSSGCSRLTHMSGSASHSPG